MKQFTKKMISSLAVIASLATNVRAAVFEPIRPEQVPSGIEYPYVQPPITDRQLLVGRRVAILASHGVEELELLAPYNYLTQQGAQVDILVPSWTPHGIVISRFLKPTLFVRATATFAQAQASSYDLLVLTGGAWNAQVVRTEPEALRLIVNHFNRKKPIGAICAGTAILINAGIARGLTMTGSPPVRLDLENAGAHFLDQSLVISGNIATSRTPYDAADFVRGLRYLLIGR